MPERRAGWSSSSGASRSGGGRRRRVSELLGIGTPETVRTGCQQAEVDAGARPGVASEDSSELKRLKRENAELEGANAILRSASAFFAAELCATRRRVDRERVRDPVRWVVAAA